MEPAEGALTPSGGTTFVDVDPEVGLTFQLSGKRWTVTDHSSYASPEGYHVDEWECDAAGGKSETAYLLRESDEEIRWYFTRPIPISAVTLSGGKPFAEVAATLAEPPDALVYRGLAHGLDETTDGTYAENPGESVQKTTWDYWDAKQELNLAVERWADGRVECFHGRRTDPKTMTVVGGRMAATLASGLRTKGPSLDLAMATLRAGGVSPGGTAVGVMSFVVGFVLFVLTLILTSRVETAFTVALCGGGLLAVAVLMPGLGHWGVAWPIVGVVLAALFYRHPPLTSGAGVAALLVAPVGLTLLIAHTSRPEGARPVAAAGFTVAAATLAAGLVNYYRFAPVPRSIGQYMLAVGPVALSGIAATVLAAMVVKVASPRRAAS